MIVYLCRISLIVKHHPMRNPREGISDLVMLMVLHLVLLMVMVELLWLLVPPASPPIKFIFSLIVVMGYFFPYKPHRAAYLIEPFSYYFDGRVDVVTGTTHTSSQKFDMGKNTHYGIF